MINIDFDIDDSGFVRAFSISGHSGFARKGKDIVCSSVSILVDSFLSSCELEEGIEFSSDTSVNGLVKFSVSGVEEGTTQRYLGFCMVLVVGLKRLTSEFPKNVRLI